MLASAEDISHVACRGLQAAIPITSRVLFAVQLRWISKQIEILDSNCSAGHDSLSGGLSKAATPETVVAECTQELVPSSLRVLRN